MYDSIPAPEAPTAPDETGARERLRRLSRLADIGLRIAERMDRQSELSSIYAETCAVPEHLHAPYARRIDEIGRAFAQVSRAVTLATALEERIETDLQAGPDARAEQALKRRLLAARANAAEATAHAGAGADTPAGAEPPARPASATPRAPDTRLRLDRALDPGLKALDAALDRDPDEIITQVRRDLDRAEAQAPPATRVSRREKNRSMAAEPPGPGFAEPEDSFREDPWGMGRATPVAATPRGAVPQRTPP
jgi:hypothetical protein